MLSDLVPNILAKIFIWAGRLRPERERKYKSRRKESRDFITRELLNYLNNRNKMPVISNIAAVVLLRPGNAANDAMISNIAKCFAASTAAEGPHWMLHGLQDVL
ncbi:hypothetical protein L798_06641 [Zootermopsis nevadensis]|uniref:Uncharacterized protein n=1 Tax=Zootermopsis nevadensis TaxID=136037 RepID=A0A067RJG1_ZOONE|nr:hypothetical protein L798_06641 [Zootermopsis nevadensis]